MPGGFIHTNVWPYPCLVCAPILRRYGIQIISIRYYLLIPPIKACKVNYHHNFGVRNDQRIYYDNGIPDIIQIGEHQFVECDVVKLWITSMVVSWTSATDCTHLYNAALSKSRQPPHGWHFGFTLDSNHVWNGFIIYCLLEDLSARKQTLVVPHKVAEDKDRY